MGDNVVPEGVSRGGESHVLLELLLLGRSVGGSLEAQGRGRGSRCQERSELLQDPSVRFTCLCMMQNFPRYF